MTDNLSQIINVFVDGVEEDYGEEIAALLHGSLHAWRTKRIAGKGSAKEEFRKNAIDLMVKHAKLTLKDATQFVGEYLTALDEQAPKTWQD